MFPAFWILELRKRATKLEKTSLRFERVLFVLASFYYKSRMLNFVYLFSWCLLSVCTKLTNETSELRGGVKFIGAFRLYDVDNDGFITRDEMYNIVDAIYQMVVSSDFRGWQRLLSCHCQHNCNTIINFINNEVLEKRHDCENNWKILLAVLKSLKKSSKYKNLASSNAKVENPCQIERGNKSSTMIPLTWKSTKLLLLSVFQATPNLISRQVSRWCLTKANICVSSQALRDKSQDAKERRNNQRLSFLRLLLMKDKFYEMKKKYEDRKAYLFRKRFLIMNLQI